MKTAAEYREFAAKCRELAAALSDPRDKQALELLAAGWEKIANARETQISKPN
jgi:hypothetical protein